MLLIAAVTWSDDAFPGHRGFAIGFVRSDGGALYELSELGYATDDDSALDAHLFAVACECGWRSPRMQGRRDAPTRPRPDYEQAALLIWHRHVYLDAEGVGVTSGVLEASALEMARIYGYQIRP
jgi:hypothetical protein